MTEQIALMKRRDEVFLRKQSTVDKWEVHLRMTKGFEVLPTKDTEVIWTLRGRKGVSRMAGRG